MGVLSEKVRSVEEAIERLWLIIDEATAILQDETSSIADKKAFAKILGDTIAILQKISSLQKGEQKIDKNRIAEALSKIPKKYQVIAEKRLYAD